MAWISIRHKWPTEAKRYKVKNCLINKEGTAFYNGYSWELVEMGKKGSLMLYIPEVETFVTHWWEENDS